jgi:hypothetical protein
MANLCPEVEWLNKMAAEAIQTPDKSVSRKWPFEYQTVWFF